MDGEKDWIVVAGQGRVAVDEGGKEAVGDADV